MEALLLAVSPALVPTIRLAPPATSSAMRAKPPVMQWEPYRYYTGRPVGYGGTIEEQWGDLGYYRGGGYGYGGYGYGYYDPYYEGVMRYPSGGYYGGWGSYLGPRNYYSYSAFDRAIGRGRPWGDGYGYGYGPYRTLGGYGYGGYGGYNMLNAYGNYGPYRALGGYGYGYGGYGGYSYGYGGYGDYRALGGYGGYGGYAPPRGRALAAAPAMSPADEAKGRAEQARANELAAKEAARQAQEAADAAAKAARDEEAQAQAREEEVKQFEQDALRLEEEDRKSVV